MEFVEEFGNLEMIYSLATSGLGTHLVKLQLKLIHFTVPLSLDDVAPQLKNLPSLRSLDTLTYYITIDNCETLHANIPSLKWLYLKNSDWTHVENELNRRRTIETTPSVTTFVMHMSNLSLTNQNGWFQYIQKKYPNLDTFIFSAPLLSYDKELVEHYHQVNLPMVLQGLGSRLTSIRLLDVDIDITIFCKLDQSGYKIKYLTLDYVKESVTDALSRSNQINYIENLTTNTLSSEFLDWLKNMKKIKSLSLKSMEVDFENIDSINNVNINLETLLQSCPETVESTDTSGLRLKYGTEIVQQQQLPVKKLTLNDISNAEGIDALVSNYLPHLKYLILDNAKETLSFPNHHFDCIKISRKHSFFGVNVTLKTLIDNKTRYYSTSDIRSRVGYLQLGDYIAPLSEDDFNDEDHIQIVCGYVKAMKLGDFQAYLK